MNDDLISRQAAIDALDNAAEQWNIAEPYHEGMRTGYRNSARLILSLPPAFVITTLQPERKPGLWIDRTDAIRAAIEEGAKHTEPKEALVAINIALAIAKILPIERTEDYEADNNHSYTNA